MGDKPCRPFTCARNKTLIGDWFPAPLIFFRKTHNNEQYSTNFDLRP